jgi:hypothetical protein
MGSMTMTDAYFLNAKDFTFAKFTPRKIGDSRALRLATSKADSTIQYVVKDAYPEIACNEFMYHHVAAALGLQTPEAKLITGLYASEHAVGIRYIPNAEKFSHATASEENKRIFYEFMALYIILNEEDSEEYYYNTDGRVIKLDNAASFNMDMVKVAGVINCNGEDLPPYLMQLLVRSLNHFEYGKYSILMNTTREHFGKKAVETAFEVFKRFAKFDLSKIEDARNALEKVYPLEICEYYVVCIEKRMETCKKFLAENDISDFIV